MTTHSGAGLVEIIAARIADALGLDQLPLPDDSFYDLGGDSLRWVTLIGAYVDRVSQPDRYAAVLEAALENPTARGLAGALGLEDRPPEEVDTDASKSSLVPEAGEAATRNRPASAGERRIWMATLDPQQRIAYTVVNRFRFARKLDPDMLRCALEALVTRHETLRTSYVDGDELVARVYAPANPSLEVHRGVVPPAELRRWARICSDLGRPDRVAALLVLTEDGSELILRIDHISVDATSMCILIDELGRFYDGAAAGVPVQLPRAASYRRWAAADREVAAHASPKGIGGLSGLSVDLPRPDGGDAETGSIELPLTLPSGPLSTLCRAASVSPFTALLSALAVVLARLTGQWKLVIAATVANRDRSSERVVGFLTNTVLLPLRLAPDRTATSILKEAHLAVTRALIGAHAPLEDQLASVAAGSARLIDVMLNLQAGATPALLIGGESARCRRVPVDSAKFPLSFELESTAGGYVGVLEADRRRVDTQVVESLGLVLDEVIRGMAVAPHQPVSSLPLLHETLRAEVDAWSRGKRVPVGPLAVDDRVRQLACEAPDVSCLLFGTEAWTRGELEERVDAVAESLNSGGLAPGQVVAIDSPRSPWFVVAILASLRCRLPWLPYSPMAGALPDTLQPAGILRPDGARPLELLRVSDSRPLPSEVAYLLPTSGSTGRPKFVLASREGLLNRLDWQNHAFPCGDDDVAVARTPPDFVDSVHELLAPLVAGIPIALVSDDTVRSPRVLVAELRRLRATRLTAVPSLYAAWIDAVPHFGAEVPTLRLLVTSGETLSSRLVHRLREAVPRARLINLYGNTETAGDVTFHEVARDEAVRLGRPISNMTAEVTDATGALLPPGWWGEVSVSGPGVALGYLDRPEDPRFQTTTVGTRTFRTGDRGRWDRYGRLQFGGRRDRQVKRMGVRIELGGVEAALLNLEGVARAAVLFDADKREVLAFVEAEADTGFEPSAVVRLPTRCRPDYVEVVERLPHTSAGKPDLATLRARPRGPHLSSLRGLVDSLEAAVLSLFREVLRATSVDPDTDFFVLGGDSVRAMHLLARITDAFGMTLGYREFADYPTARGVAARVRGAPSSLAAPERATPRPRNLLHAPLPLSFSQEGLWYLSCLHPQSAAYVLPFVVEVEGPLQAETLRAAFEALVRRHEALRTVVLMGAPPLQRVLPEVQIHWVEPTADDAGGGEHPAWVGSFVGRPVDPTKARLDVALAPARRGSAWILAVGLHHLFVDGRSLRILFEDFVEEVRIRQSGVRAHQRPAPALHLADLAIAERRSLDDHELNLLAQRWHTRFGVGAAQGLTALCAVPDPSNLRCRTCKLELRPSLRTALEALASRNGATFFEVLLAAMSAVVWQYWGVQRSSIAFPATRPHPPAAESTVANLVNTLVVRTELGATTKLLELVLRTHADVSHALSLARLPFDRLVRSIGGGSEGAVASQVLFALQERVGGKRDIAGGSIAWYRAGVPHAKFDLSLDVVLEPKEWFLSLEIREGFLDLILDKEVLLQYVLVLEQMAEAPETPLRYMALHPESANRYSALQRPAASAEADLATLVWHLLRKESGQLILVRGDERWTRRRLRRRVEELAGRLKRAGVADGHLVVLRLPRGPVVVATMLAVWRRGAAFACIAPETPEPRVERLLAGIGAFAVVEGNDAEVRVRSLGGTPVHRPRSAYAVFTSGTTGEPRCAVVDRGNLASMAAAWRQAFGLDRPGERHLQVAPIAFDVFVADLARVLVSDGVLVFCPSEARLDGAALYGLLEDGGIGGIDVVELVPGVARLLLRHLERRNLRLTRVRLLVVGSDVWYRREWDALAARMRRGTRLVSSYGTAEATVDSTYFEDRGVPWTGTVPIGRPFPGVRGYVVRVPGCLAPAGGVGELVIGGRGVGAGYASGGEDRFTEDPFERMSHTRVFNTGDRARLGPSGDLEFFGRIDGMLKVGSRRLDPSEVEQLLMHEGEVREVAVAALHTGALGAWVVTEGAIDVRDLQRRLAAKLPAWMVPTAITRVDALPFTSNGKVDRAHLPAPTLPDSRPPETALEIEIAAIWHRVLGRAEIGANESFFSVGGHSIALAEMAADIAELFGTEVPLRTLFVRPTISQIARWIGGQEATPVQATTAIEDSEGLRIRVRELVPGRWTAPLQSPTCVLLTGATGFVGSAILRVLLDTTSVLIVCPVRADSASEAVARVSAALGRHGGNIGFDPLRLQVFPTDLAVPLLGLDERAHRRLAQRTDTIVHAAWAVDFMSDYESLRLPTVIGTLRLLEFAASGGPMRFHFVSTSSVADRLEPASRVPPPQGGYNQTKWVAELLLEEAAGAGMSVGIYRPGWLGGFGTSGLPQSDSLLWSVLRTCVFLGAAPDLDLSVRVLGVHRFAADLVARLADPARLGRVQPPGTPWQQVVTALGGGTDLPMWPPRIWLDRGRSERVTPAQPFLALLRAPEPGWAALEDEVPGKAGPTVCETEFLDEIERMRCAGRLPRRLDRVALPATMTLRSARQLVSTGAITSRRLTEAALTRISLWNDDLHAVVHLRENAALEDAQARDRAPEPSGVLHGIPITVKCSLDRMGMESTTGVPGEERIAETTAPAVAALECAGGVLLGKTNAAAHLSDWQARNERFGATRNPLDGSRTAGGSSGGAAAVAAGLSVVDLGSDLLGSTLLPAAFCGVFGHRPTERLVPAAGQFDGTDDDDPLYSMSSLGLITRSGWDLEEVLPIIAHGGLPRCSRYRRLGDYRIGVIDLDGLPVGTKFRDALDVAWTISQTAGCRLRVVRDAPLADLRGLHALTLSMISLLYARENLTDEAAHPDATPQQALVDAWNAGCRPDRDWLNEFLFARNQARLAFDALCREWDLFLCPTTVSPAFPHIEGASIRPGSVPGKPFPDAPLADYEDLGLFAAIPALLGGPATTFPVPDPEGGLPGAVMVLGPRGGDRCTIFAATSLAEALGAEPVPIIDPRGPP